MFILGLKNLPHLRHNKTFPQKIGFLTFIYMLNPNYIRKFRTK